MSTSISKPRGDDADTPLPTPEETVTFVRSQIGKMADAFQRAQDGLASDDAKTIHWLYVAAQLGFVEQYLEEAIEAVDVQVEVNNDDTVPADPPGGYPGANDVGDPPAQGEGKDGAS